MAGTLAADAKKEAGEIELTTRFSQQMAQLCMSADYSDVTFCVEKQRLPGHRVILAARSEYFRALLYGGLAESHQSEIELNIPVEAFKALLRYIYSGYMYLSQMREEHVLDTLGLANQYGFTELEQAISEYLRQLLALDNACAILDAARLYSLSALTDVCHTFFDRHADQMLTHDTFKTLSQDALCGLLERDSFFAPEVQIFTAVNDWCQHNPGGAIDSVVALVRLPLMNLEQLLKVVRPSGILPADRLLDVIEEKTTAQALEHRGALWPEENVAAAQKFGSKCVHGEFRDSLLDDNCTAYDLENGYTRHIITGTTNPGIVVELGTISIINHIKILLWDRDNRSYFYYVDVSVNQQQWDRVVDHTEYNCRSWQHLYFPARAVRYIKLVGTHNTENKIFHVVSLRAMHVAAMPELRNGLVAPTSNVATVDMSAVVIKGVSRTRNALLNGDVKTYDWDSGYTCHQLGSGDIVIQLGQPYWLGSVRLLLWDCDERTYCFYIETSTNQKQWEMVVDRRTVNLRSWQTLTFRPRPVVFIKIVGTYNTANEVRYILNFEKVNISM